MAFTTVGEANGLNRVLRLLLEGKGDPEKVYEDALLLAKSAYTRLTGAGITPSQLREMWDAKFCDQAGTGRQFAGDGSGDGGDGGVPVSA